MLFATSKASPPAPVLKSPIQLLPKNTHYGKFKPTNKPAYTTLLVMLLFGVGLALDGSTLLNMKPGGG